MIKKERRSRVATQVPRVRGHGGGDVQTVGGEVVEEVDSKFTSDCTDPPGVTADPEREDLAARNPAARRTEPTSGRRDGLKPVRPPSHAEPRADPSAGRGTA